MSRRVKRSLLTIAVLALLCLGGFEMYRVIGSKQWAAERTAVETAYDQTILYSASNVVPFVGDHPYMVVYGQDKLRKDMMVWIGEKELHVEYAADGISSQEAARKVTARDPENHVIRTSAGKLFDDYIWEVYYNKKEDGVVHYYYDYFRFQDGQYIDTLRLTLN